MVTNMVIYSKAVKENDSARRSQLLKLVVDLHLAIADIKAKLEQPQAMGGGA